MTAAQEDLVRADAPRDSTTATRGSTTLTSPRVEDGAALWRIARDSRVLDLNSSYSYLLWCRDFAATSLVARDATGAPIAFVTGYVRPDRPRALVVWQIAVDRAHRGRGLAGELLDALTARVTAQHGVREIETTITPDNTASHRLFTAYARRHGVGLAREVLFDGSLFPREPEPGPGSGPGSGPDGGPDGPGPGPGPGGDALPAHQPEVLYRIGPFPG
ncbi:diaminobutyrate acetyltransferase [Streptomyces yaizuensis]|uniref:L-2,4-diaminobutyric acid acetyltransferase n=1 Tax=Streptomyces yaizuensis TaxID=2989713 RepID=A0ABQ5P7W7_9ACTN|nr:diaminobutyrate acetyltransferase [Streptomyces sp. YSPA8]GLF98665.1 diaminobutyrate acetyltransferase [Streptomyces sp. YSPA8]